MQRHTENTEVIDDSQWGFMKGKLCLTNLGAFCKGVTAMVGEGRVTDIYLCSCKASATVLHNILVPKLGRDGFDRWVWAFLLGYFSLPQLHKALHWHQGSDSKIQEKQDLS